MVSNFKFITLFSKLNIKYNNIKLNILQIYVHCTIINSIEVCGYYYLSVMIFLTLFIIVFIPFFSYFSFTWHSYHIFFCFLFSFHLYLSCNFHTGTRQSFIPYFPLKTDVVRVTHHIWKGKKCPTCVLW